MPSWHVLSSSKWALSLIHSSFRMTTLFSSRNSTQITLREKKKQIKVVNVIVVELTLKYPEIFFPLPPPLPSWIPH
jgi:hypothetical protein